MTTTIDFDPYPGLVHPVECGCNPCWKGLSVKAGHGLHAGDPVAVVNPVGDGQPIAVVLG